MKKKTSKHLSIEQITLKHSLGDFKLKTEPAYFAEAKSVHIERHKFMRGVRHVFLKYLPLVDTESFLALFTEKQRIMIKMGNVPTGWNIHHQKSLQWGGRNFNPALIQAVYQTKLTEEQKQRCENSQGGKYFEEAFLLDNFLTQAQQQNRLKETFLKLFNGYLILLPVDAHECLELKFLQPQAHKFQKIKKFKPSLAETYKFSYPVWNQIILWGQTFEMKKAPRMVAKGKNPIFNQTAHHHTKA